MFSFRRPIRFFLAAQLALVIACGGSRPEVSAETAAPTTVMFDQPTEPEIVRGALARALNDRGYRVESEEGSRIIAAYGRRGAELRIVLDYTPDRATLQYLESTGVEQQQYEGWMRNLERSIRAELARPAAVAEPVTPEPTPVDRGPAPMTIVVEPPREAGVVRGAVSRALVARRYVVESEDGERIVARYTRGDEIMRITVAYTGQSAVISLVESEHVEPAQYESWMRNLQSTVQEELGR